MENFNSGNYLSGFFRITVKNPYKPEAPLSKINVRGDSSAKISCAYKYRPVAGVDSEYFSDGFMQFFYIVAVSLLTEASEAV